VPVPVLSIAPVGESPASVIRCNDRAGVQSDPRLTSRSRTSAPRTRHRLRAHPPPPRNVRGEARLRSRLCLRQVRLRSRLRLRLTRPVLLMLHVRTTSFIRVSPFHLYIIASGRPVNAQTSSPSVPLGAPPGIPAPSWAAQVDEEYANGPAAFAPVPDLVRSPNTSVSSEEGDGTLGMQAIMEAALEGFDEYDEEADYLPQVFPDDSVSVAGARSGVRDDATATVTAGSNIEPTDDGWGGAPTYDDGWWRTNLRRRLGRRAGVHGLRGRAQEQAPRPAGLSRARDRVSEGYLQASVGVEEQSDPRERGGGTGERTRGAAREARSCAGEERQCGW
jgi:hypothetical protein